MAELNLKKKIKQTFNTCKITVISMAHPNYQGFFGPLQIEQEAHGHVILN